MVLGATNSALTLASDGSVAGGGVYDIGSNAMLTVTTSNNWFDLPGTGDADSVIIPINPDNAAIFYRLRQPQPKPIQGRVDL